MKKEAKELADAASAVAQSIVTSLCRVGLVETYDAEAAEAKLAVDLLNQAVVIVQSRRGTTALEDEQIVLENRLEKSELPSSKEARRSGVSTWKAAVDRTKEQAAAQSTPSLILGLLAAYGEMSRKAIVETIGSGALRDTPMHAVGKKVDSALRDLRIAGRIDRREEPHGTLYFTTC